MRAELHGHPQSDRALDHLQADRDGSERPCRQYRNRVAERLGLHRAPVRSAPLWHQPLGLGRQRGRHPNGRLSRISHRRSRHQGDRDVHRDGARARALRRRARPRRRRRKAGGRAQGGTHGAHAARDHEPYRRARRGIAGVLGSVEGASRDRGERPRRDERGAGGVPRRALAARQGNFGGDRLRRPRRDDPRQRHRRGLGPSRALAHRARRGRTRDRPHHRRRQPVRRLGQRRLRRQPVPGACWKT